MFVGCGAVTTAETVRRARAVAEGGATGVAVTQQFVVLNATQAEICDRFASVAKAVDLPIMLFNTPQRSGFSVTHDYLEAMLDVAPIVAVKQSDPNLTFVAQSLRQFRDRARHLRRHRKQHAGRPDDGVGRLHLDGSRPPGR